MRYVLVYESRHLARKSVSLDGLYRRLLMKGKLGGISSLHRTFDVSSPLD